LARGRKLKLGIIGTGNVDYHGLAGAGVGGPPSMLLDRGAREATPLLNAATKGAAPAPAIKPNSKIEIAGAAVQKLGPAARRPPANG
jgi:hypothetical protein